MRQRAAQHCGHSRADLARKAPSIPPALDGLAVTIRRVPSDDRLGALKPSATFVVIRVIDPVVESKTPRSAAPRGCVLSCKVRDHEMPTVRQPRIGLRSFGLPRSKWVTCRMPPPGRRPRGPRIDCVAQKAHSRSMRERSAIRRPPRRRAWMPTTTLNVLHEKPRALAAVNRSNDRNRKRDEPSRMSV